MNRTFWRAFQHIFLEVLHILERVFRMEERSIRFQERILGNSMYIFQSFGTNLYIDHWPVRNVLQESSKIWTNNIHSYRLVCIYDN